MKTFAIRNGDLDLQGGAYALVDGPSKVHQDLGLALKEPFGIDRFHPRWGSLLLNYLGEPVNDATALLVRSEIGRVIQNYVGVQNDLLGRSYTSGKRSPFSTGELIQSIEDIKVEMEYDRFRVRVDLLTVSGEQVTLRETVRT